jgi:5-oxoprolinase (ATP-hydrolysing) subunit A
MGEIDLNSDVGEGFGTDDELLAVVTSANVACGFHAGDEQTMRSVCAAAAERGVAVGAHVSYRDREGFGRHELGVGEETIEADVAEQLALLGAIAGERLTYVKPHGALYHRASVDAGCAAAIVAAILAHGRPLAVLAFPGSQLFGVAQNAGLVAVAEGFSDRGYTPDGTLLPRGEAGAVLDADAAARQAVRLAGGVGSICIHGDSPAAPQTARRVADALRAAGFDLRAFA